MTMELTASRSLRQGERPRPRPRGPARHALEASAFAGVPLAGVEWTVGPQLFGGAGDDARRRRTSRRRPRREERRAHGRGRLPRHVGDPARQAAAGEPVRQEDRERAPDRERRLHLGSALRDLRGRVRERRHRLPRHDRDAGPLDVPHADVARGHRDGDDGLPARRTAARSSSTRATWCAPRSSGSQTRLRGHRRDRDRVLPVRRDWKPLHPRSSATASRRAPSSSRSCPTSAARWRRSGSSLEACNSEYGPAQIESTEVRRAAAGGRRHRHLQVGGEGDRAPARRPRDLHVEAVPGLLRNGTHIHVSLRDASGENVFAPRDLDDAGSSRTG